jgi:hypothetical protein
MAFKNLLNAIAVDCPGCEASLSAAVCQEEDDQIFYEAECRGCALKLSVCVESNDERS